MTRVTPVMEERHKQAARAQEIWNDFISDRYEHVRALPSPVVPENPHRAVVMLEPRRHEHMEFVLRLALHFLGRDWGLELFIGPANREFVERMVSGWGAVRIHDIGESDLSVVAYNSLKKEPDLWRSIGAEHVLWLEPDCIVCHGDIEPYLEFDYIGAPWRPDFAFTPSCRVGNGGLSLRRKQAMLEVAEAANLRPDVFLTEDIFFVANMHMMNRVTPQRFQIATEPVARSFSVESVYHPRPFGLHKTWRYLGPDVVRSLLQGIVL